MAKPLRIKAEGLSDIDYSSLKSMLNLAAPLLNNPWVLVDDGETDLSIFSLETEQGKVAWQQHQTGLSAILTNDTNTNLQADIVLKKPLRTQNFSEALNKIEKKLKFTEQAQQLAKNNDNTSPVKDKVIEDKKPSFLKSLSNKLLGSKGPAADLPPLSLQLPEVKNNKPDTILEPTLLKKWLNELPENDVDKITTAILGHIIPLNRSSLPAEKRLALLDIYKTPVTKLVFNRDINAINKEINSPIEFLRSVKSLRQLLTELVIGYKIVLNEKYQSGERPNSNDAFLIAIIRACELSGLLMVHAYRYYRSIPDQALNELHQLYLYCEASKTTQKTINSKSYAAPLSFQHFYSQILLTAIADPYSLAKFDVFRLFNLMDEMATKVIIRPLSESQKKSPAGFLGRGNFCIDCDSDSLPIAINKTPDKLRLSDSIRLFSTQEVLEDISSRVKKFANTNLGTYDLDYKLMRKIIPQINSSYERKYQRLPQVDKRPIQIAYGVDASCNQLCSELKNQTVEWKVLNEGTSGVMVSLDHDNSRRLNIDELVGLFEPEQETRLATIRWLHTDNNDTSLLGLEFINGEPKAVTFTADGETEILNGLLLPADKAVKQDVSILVEKGIYSKNRTFRMKHDDETMVIKTDKLLVKGFNFEQFSFIVMNDKKPAPKR